MHASDVDPKAPTRRGDQNLGQFERILMDELVPLVRQRYPVQTGASGWGIAGLSLGGEFAVYAGLRHPELFSHIASISGSLVPRGDPEEDLPSMDQRFGPALARPTIARYYKLIWIGCGNTDIICRGSRAFTQGLDTANVAHVWREYQGALQMPVFRRELVDLPPFLPVDPYRSFQWGAIVLGVGDVLGTVVAGAARGLGCEPEEGPPPALPDRE